MGGALVRPAWRAVRITRLTEGERHDDYSSLLLNSTASLSPRSARRQDRIDGLQSPTDACAASGSKSPAKTSRLFTSQTEALSESAAFELRGKRPRSRWPQSQAARASLAIHAPRDSLRCPVAWKDHIRLWPWLRDCATAGSSWTRFRRGLRVSSRALKNPSRGVRNREHNGIQQESGTESNCGGN